nr:peptide deformylase [Alistipes sp.]
IVFIDTKGKCLDNTVNDKMPATMSVLDAATNNVADSAKFTGKPARVIQHEYDHIEGMVFTDHLAPIRKNLIKNKLQKMARGSYKAFYKTKR